MTTQNSNCEKTHTENATTQNSNCDHTQIVRKLKTQVVTKLKNSNCDKTQKLCDKDKKLKLGQNLKTHIATKPYSNCDKTLKLKF